MLLGHLQGSGTNLSGLSHLQHLGEGSPPGTGSCPQSRGKVGRHGEWLGVGEVQECQAHQLQRAGQSRALLLQRLARQSG